jgi:hypothetical protein
MFANMQKYLISASTDDRPDLVHLPAIIKMIDYLFVICPGDNLSLILGRHHYR